MAEITELVELTSIAEDDELVVYDVSVGAGNSKKVTRQKLLEGVARNGGNHNFGTSEIANLTTQNASIGFTDGATLTKVLHLASSVDVGDLMSETGETQTVTLTGALTTDQLAWAMNGILPDGIVCQAWISAADTVSFRFYNSTGSLVAGATYGVRVTAMRFA